MAGENVPQQQQEILDRLSAHGIHPRDYILIKSLVSFGFPQARVLFVQQFGRRTISQVLDQIDKTRQFLEKDFLLSADERSEIAKSVSRSEFLVWQTLLESNWPKTGPWTLSSAILPTGRDSNQRPLYRRPALRLTVVNSETKEARRAVIPGRECNDLARWPSAWKRAFEKLGIWDLVFKGPVHRRVVSARRPSGWPVFTQGVIPRVYEYLRPHYAKPGHYSERRDSFASGKASFPKELFEDMLLILRFEHPGTFQDTTINQFKADVQRHLERKRAAVLKPRNSAENKK